MDVHDGATDLIGLDPAGGAWEPHTVHTHYFGFQVPEAGIGAFLYVRYQPYFPLSQGSVIVFQGRDNVAHLDVAHLDWQMAMPWPDVDGTTITTANGLRIEFLKPGRAARLTYAADGCAFELVQTAITPLIARGAVIPGENLHQAHEPGGSEQFMHCVGELTLRGRDYAVDCFMPRDRSWRQSRTEQRGGRHDPPVAWTPFYFPETGLAFNQVGFEAEPPLPIPAGMPTFHFAWVCEDDELRGITEVRRTVHELHPLSHVPLRQTIEAVDEHGAEYRFEGEMLACAAIPSWPNASTWDSVMRWTDADGDVAHGPCQGIWYDAFQQLMKDRRDGR